MFLLPFDGFLDPSSKVLLGRKPEVVTGKWQNLILKSSPRIQAAGLEKEVTLKMTKAKKEILFPSRFWKARCSRITLRIDWSC